MAADGATRQQLLRAVRDGIADELAAAFEASDFRFLRRDAAFHRERDGVAASFSLGISSRPPSLGHVGILVYPMLVIAVPRWSADVEQRTASWSGPLQFHAGPSPVMWTALEWHVPGRRPLWTLSDVPTEAEVRKLAIALRDSVIEAGLPFFEHWATASAVLEERPAASSRSQARRASPSPAGPC